MIMVVLVLVMGLRVYVDLFHLDIVLEQSFEPFEALTETVNLSTFNV
jgi:hypothetical protein